MFADFLCEVGDPAELEAFSWLQMNIFLDLNFTCEGEIKEWTLFVKQDVSGSVYLSVWRETGLDQYNMVGYNRIEVARRGLMTVPVPEEDRIEVQKGDCIATHMDDDAPKGLIANGFNVNLRALKIPWRHAEVVRFNGSISLPDLEELGYMVSKVLKTVSLRALVGK